MKVSLQIKGLAKLGLGKGKFQEEMDKNLCMGLLLNLNVIRAVFTLAPESFSLER